MDIIAIISIALAVLAIVLVWIFTRKKKRRPVKPLSVNEVHILENEILFYQNLNDENKKHFQERVQVFLKNTKITGIKTEVEDMDRIMIASSAIIPIFGFPDWEYMNLKEVLLYPDSFNEHFAHEGDDRYTSGLVGDGPYQNIMILSRHALREGFANNSGKSNTAIHEFVHLLDKTDGAIDGIPEFMLDRQYILPWLELMREKINEIHSENSDINPYGATNQAEFFAVASEYFFERPDLLQENHPELYQVLSKIFRQTPG